MKIKLLLCVGRERKKLPITEDNRLCVAATFWSMQHRKSSTIIETLGSSPKVQYVRTI